MSPFGEGRDRPSVEITDRHHVAMAREAEMGATGAMSGEKIVDVRRAGLRKRHPLVAGKDHYD